MFNEYPYTDYHELNTDWIIGKIKNVETAEANTKEYSETAVEAKDIAVQAKDIAVQAKNDAESARDDAQTAENNAAAIVADTNNQISVLQARVDNIIPDGTQTAGNTELLDIRVAYDGQTYDSAGNAVRGQISEILTGEPVKHYNMTFDEFKTLLPTFNNYDAAKITISDDVNSNGFISWLYKIDPFVYTIGEKLTLEIKVKVNSCDGDFQRVEFRLMYYDGTEKKARMDCYTDHVLYTDQDGNPVRYEIGEEFTIKIKSDITTINTFNKHVAIAQSNSSLTVNYDILSYEVYKTPESETVRVKYSDEANHALSADSISGHLQGKTWGAIGDSLTATYFDVYVSYVQDGIGIIPTNYGIGGTCVANIATADATPSFVDRVCGLNGQPGYTDSFDLWTVFGGTNDIIKNVPLGSIDDLTDSTFYGAYNLIIQHLLDLPNHPTVALITPYNMPQSSDKNYVEAVVALGEKYGLPVLNLFTLSGINDFTRSYYLRDGVHPTQAGADKLRPIILEWFQNLRISETTPAMPH